jgi:hypothetical protein
MKKTALALAWGLVLSVPPVSADEPKVDYKPLSIGAVHEFGQLGKGQYGLGPTQSAEIYEMDWFDHFGAFVTKEAVVEDRLHLFGGLGGIFQFRKPEKILPGFYGTQRKAFYIGPTKAMAEYWFGDEEKPWLKLGTGTFMYKYNPDAKNLGEYLFRSGAYPTTTITGGYLFVNSAAANVQGFKGSFDLGSFKADLLMSTETSFAPLYDWSLAGIVSYSVAGGLLDLGAGVNFKGLIPVKPSRSTKEVDNNGYFTYNGKDYVTNTDRYELAASYYNGKNTAADSAKAAPYTADLDVVKMVDTMTVGKPAIHYFTSSGTLLMGRASLDFKKLFGSELFAPEDLKLYTEVAVLGVKNYPVYYQKISERMPIMVGFNVPTFKLLDLFAVQVEQMKSPWLNNLSQVGNNGLPLPFFPSAQDTVVSKTDYNDLATKDDLKWSILLQKKLGANVTLSGQVANDHLRLVSASYYYGPQFDHNEITVSKDHWYWMMQLGWGI